MPRSQSAVGRPKGTGQDKQLAHFWRARAEMGSMRSVRGAAMSLRRNPVKPGAPGRELGLTWLLDADVVTSDQSRKRIYQC
ncbi:hypothetical protein EYF80_055564 [Liparis tanakae]|uniref:Uncharacterized protein n=1 Tax=Liparis tanakae TaxID=230148 RepID=A0A4Z2F074_9TELE|nr:hypothetical protein EYF80_055564 [Liparis tanakae]